MWIKYLDTSTKDIPRKYIYIWVDQGDQVEPVRTCIPRGVQKEWEEYIEETDTRRRSERSEPDEDLGLFDFGRPYGREEDL